MQSIRVWAPTVAMMLVSLISYVDRNTLALLSPAILAETGLSAQQYGYIISAFSVAYMIGNPVWGSLLDRFGLRRGMLSAVFFWTLASAAHAFAGGLWSFGAARAMLGFGEGATFPGGLRAAAQTLPESLRSRGIAVAYSGGSLGAIITPLLITPIAARFGWRGAFWFTGMVGLAWLVLWAIVGSRIPVPTREPRQQKDALRLTDPRLWAFMSAYAFGALPLGFVIYGAAIYLTKVRGLTQVEVGSLLWIPPLGWEIGYFFWGWTADRMRGRLQPIFLFITVFSLPLILVPKAGPIWLVMAGLFFAMFVGAGFLILSIAYATEVFPVSQSGLIAGVGAGSWSAAVALAMPVFGRLFDQSRYDTAFTLAAVVPLLGYAGWRWMDRKAVSVRSVRQAIV
jgi:MFS transporter, ACS family, aldohexuronate transporter